MRGMIGSSIQAPVSSVSPCERCAPAAAASAAFRPGWPTASVAGLAEKFVKHADMAGIDANVWPLGLRELLSG